MFDTENFFKSVGACFGCALFIGLCGGLWGMANFFQGGLFYLVWAFYLFLLGFIFSLPFLFIIGMPVQFILQKLKLTDFFSNTAAAAICTPALAIFYSTINVFRDEEDLESHRFEWHDLTEPDTLKAIGILAIIGFIIGSVLWLIRRPDLDTKSAKQTTWPIKTKQLASSDMP